MAGHFTAHMQIIQDTISKTSDKMKLLLTITALLEGITGLILAVTPSLLVSILLGTALTDPGAIVIGRLAGAALITIAVACWLSRKDTQSSVMVKAMLGYNIFSLTLMVYAVLVARIAGPGLWPAIIIHFGLLVWCFSALRKHVQEQHSILQNRKLH